MHSIRSAYGWTDTEILEHIRLYGNAWINETIGFINEDRRNELEEEIARRRWAIYVAPLARTAQTKSGVSSISKLQKQLLKALDDMLPWKKEQKREQIRERLKRPPKSETKVIE